MCGDDIKQRSSSPSRHLFFTVPFLFIYKLRLRFCHFRVKDSVPALSLFSSFRGCPCVCPRHGMCVVSCSLLVDAAHHHAARRAVVSKGKKVEDDVSSPRCTILYTWFFSFSFTGRVLCMHALSSGQGKKRRRCATSQPLLSSQWETEEERELCGWLCIYKLGSYTFTHVHLHKKKHFISARSDTSSQTT